MNPISNSTWNGVGSLASICAPWSGGLGPAVHPGSLPLRAYRGASHAVRERKEETENTSVPDLFISHAFFLPKKIVPLNPWWIQGQKQDNQPVSLWSVAAGHPPLSQLSCGSREETSKADLLLILLVEAWLPSAGFREEMRRNLPLSLARVPRSPNDLSGFSRDSLCLVDANKKPSQSVSLWLIFI